MKSICVFLVVLLLNLFSGAAIAQQNRSETMKRMLDHYVEMWNEGDFSKLNEVVHPQFELLMSPDYKAETGLESLKARIIKTRTAYPDFHIKVHELHFDSSCASALWTITATNSGQGEIAPTGKRVEVKGMSLIHFQDGKLKDEWISGNDYLWLKQLGFSLVPPSGHE